MFKILDGREMFYQWDTNRKLLIEDRTILQVHFCNRTSNCSIVRCAYDVGGLWVVDVPDIVLQESYRLNVYGYNTEYTKYSDSFNIVARSKPADYITNDIEKQTWEQLEERIAAIEENGVSEEVVVNAVNEYLKENPVSAGATAAEAAQIAANKEDIAAIKAVAETHATEAYVDAAIANAQIGGGSGDIDLTDYATKKYVDDAVAAIPSTDLTGYATEKWVEEKGYLTAHQSLEGYAKTTDIPDVSKFQTAEQVNAAIVAYVGAIENGTY